MTNLPLSTIFRLEAYHILSIDPLDTPLVEVNSRKPVGAISDENYASFKGTYAEERSKNSHVECRKSWFFGNVDEMRMRIKFKLSKPPHKSRRELFINKYATAFICYIFFLSLVLDFSNNTWKIEDCVRKVVSLAQQQEHQFFSFTLRLFLQKKKFP